MPELAASIAPRTTVGPVRLVVADLGRSLAFYRDAVGLEVVDRGGERATLGVAGNPLLVLDRSAGARPADGFTGLYHFALLVPGRADLARWLTHALRAHVALTGAADHFVSEAVYLSDPDRHGIEIYRDRPREHWAGRVERMGTWPLDVPDLLASARDEDRVFEGLPAGTRMGHVHLRVADVAATIAFYRDLLGLELTARLGREAAFLAAGGYHHHIGANTWESQGAGPAPAGAAALVHATLVLPDAAERDRVVARVVAANHAVATDDGRPTLRDPSGNRWVLATGA